MSRRTYEEMFTLRSKLAVLLQPILYFLDGGQHHYSDIVCVTPYRVVRMYIMSDYCRLSVGRIDYSGRQYAIDIPHGRVREFLNKMIVKYGGVV